MKKLGAVLVGVLAAIGIGLVVFRRKQGAWDSAAGSARETATAWGGSAADQASHAADKVAQHDTEASHTVAEQAKREAVNPS
jgi:hypothetical protein